MEIVNRYLWIVLIVAIIILAVKPGSNFVPVVEKLSYTSLANVQALQGNAGNQGGNYIKGT